MTPLDRDARVRGQAMIEYLLVTLGILGFTVLGWPYLVQLLDGLDAYFQSIYYVIQSPVP